jgi:hypothetical protein
MTRLWMWALLGWGCSGGEPEVCQLPLEDLCAEGCAAEELSCLGELVEVDCAGFVAWRCASDNDRAELYLYDEAGALVAGATHTCPAPLDTSPQPCGEQAEWVTYGEATAEVLACVTATDPGRECYE